MSDNEIHVSVVGRCTSLETCRKKALCNIDSISSLSLATFTKILYMIDMLVHNMSPMYALYSFN